jgi:hypothetical protein
MNRIIKTAASKPVESFNGMPQAKLARAMWALGTRHIQGYWRSFVQHDHYACIERDCDVVSRLEDGKLAWVLMGDKSFLIEVGPVLWDKDKSGRSLQIDMEPPVCVGENRTLGLRFLELQGSPNQKLDFYLINTFAAASERIRPAACFELAGLATMHNAWRSRDVDEMEAHSSEVWTQMLPERNRGELVNFN